MSVEIPLKHKYRSFKPKGKHRADYAGHTSKHRKKHARGLNLPYRISR